MFNNDDDSVCSICLDEKKLNIKIMNCCKKIICADCVIKCFHKSVNCPLCRQPKTFINLSDLQDFQTENCPNCKIMTNKDSIKVYYNSLSGVLRCDKCIKATPYKTTYKINEYIKKMGENYNEGEFKESYGTYKDNITQCKEFLKNYVKEISKKFEENLLTHIDSLLEKQVNTYDLNIKTVDNFLETRKKILQEDSQSRDYGKVIDFIKKDNDSSKEVFTAYWEVLEKKNDFNEFCKNFKRKFNTCKEVILSNLSISFVRVTRNLLFNSESIKNFKNSDPAKFPKYDDFINGVIKEIFPDFEKSISKKNLLNRKRLSKKQKI